MSRLNKSKVNAHSLNPYISNRVICFGYRQLNWSIILRLHFNFHNVVVEKYKEDQPDYFPEQLVDKWLHFSHLGLYYCYKISLEGCSETTPAEIVLVVKSDMGSDFTSNSFKLFGVQDYVSVTIRYVGIIHLNQEQVNFGLTLSCSVIVIPSFLCLFH